MIAGPTQLRSVNLKVVDIGTFKNQFDGNTVIDRNLILSIREESKQRKDVHLKSLEYYRSKNYEGVIDQIKPTVANPDLLFLRIKALLKLHEFDLAS